MKKNFSVKGMSCGHCKKAVESALEKLDGVEEAKVNLEAEEVTVKFDDKRLELAALKDEVRAAGYEVTE